MCVYVYVCIHCMVITYSARIQYYKATDCRCTHEQPTVCCTCSDQPLRHKCCWLQTHFMDPHDPASSTTLLPAAHILVTLAPGPAPKGMTRVTWWVSAWNLHWNYTWFVSVHEGLVQHKHEPVHSIITPFPHADKLCRIFWPCTTKSGLTCRHNTVCCSDVRMCDAPHVHWQLTKSDCYHASVIVKQNTVYVEIFTRIISWIHEKISRIIQPAIF